MKALLAQLLENERQLDQLGEEQEPQPLVICYTIWKSHHEVL